MRKFLWGLCVLAWPVVAVADDTPILLRPPLPEGLTPPRLTTLRLLGGRLPDIVMNGHATIEVCFLIDVDSEGRTANVTVLKHSDVPDFDDKMTNSIRALRWKPAERNGKPVAVRMIFQNLFQGFSTRGPQLPAEPCSWDLYKDTPDGNAAAPPPPH
jgi:hypothetical protein